MKNTKRIVSALLAGAVTVGVVSSFALTSADVTSTAKFDENNIVLSFGSMSDLHFASSDSHGHDKMLNKAVATFQDLAGGKDKLDAVLLAGDLTDYGTKDEFAKPAQRFKDALAGTDTEVVYALGNHDAYGPCDFKTENWVQDAFGSLSQKNPIENSSTQAELNRGNYHTKINGVHFITVYGIDGNHSPDNLAWLEKQLQIAQKEDPTKPIIVATHVHPANTCYGSIQEQTRWFSTTITPILAKYPQVISYSGHTHFPNQNDSSLWQGKFTSINTGSMRYMSFLNGYIENGDAQEFWNSDSGKISNAQFTEIDKNGIVRVRRINLDNGKELGSIIKDPYVFPTMESEADAVYTNEARSKIAGPKFESNTKFDVKVSTAYNSVAAIVNFGPAKATEDMISSYAIYIREKDSGKILKEVRSIAPYYLYDDPKTQMKESERTVYISTVDLESEKDYQVCVSALNSFDTYGEPLVYDFKAAKYSDKVTYDYNIKMLADFDNLQDGIAQGTDKNATDKLVAYNAEFGKSSNVKGITTGALKGNALVFEGITTSARLEATLKLKNENPSYKQAQDPQMLSFFIDTTNAKSNTNKANLAINIKNGTKEYKISENSTVIFCTKDATTTSYVNAKGEFVITNNYVGRILIPIKSFIATTGNEIFSGNVEEVKFTFPQFFRKGSTVVIDELGLLVPKTEEGSVESPLLPDETIGTDSKYEVGDVNRDGQLNTLDPLAVLKYAAKMQTLDDEQLYLADYNKDTKVNTLDSLVMLKKIVNVI